jgi:sugar O-acyltransferase (sialic acid O-acetyltransferase NeuD family)
MNKNIALIGYSGHAYVAFEIFFSQGQIVSAYTELQEKKENPFMLSYLGWENDDQTISRLRSYDYFVGIGDNALRQKISENLIKHLGSPQTALHKSAIISRSMNAGTGIMIAPRATVNAKSTIGNGVILNTGCIVEHECIVGNYAHIAPGTILCGNVTIGDGTLVGAGSVVLPGITVGKNVTIGAGSVVTKNIEDNIRITGNPARKI